MNTSLLNTLKNLIYKCDSSVNIEDINEGSDLVIDFGFNSFSFVRLLVEIEEEFGAEIGFEYLASGELSKISRLCELIEESMNENADR